MNLILKTSRVVVSPSGAFIVQNVGDVIQVPPDDGRRLVASGQAEECELIETAAIDPRDEIRGPVARKRGRSYG